ncbi:MAG: nitroreductase family protein [Bacilli bacterium]|nr:nitroreductase family protein [Bacilli bacterium]
METKEIIEKRRSIRSFEKDQIEDSIIKDILYDGTMAPSAHHKQPWEFIVIKNELIKNKIASFLIEKDLRMGKESSSSHTARVIKEAPVCILVYNKYEEQPLMNTLSVGAAIQNMLLSATDHGLGSLWVGNVCKVEDEIQKLLGKNMRLMSAVLLGYVKEYPNKPERNLVDAITEWKI